MKTNHYESVIILNATLEDPQINSILSSLEEQMSANGVEITEIENLGRKRLAYQIQKGKSGYYAIYRFASPREYITKFERTLRLDENIIRFLTIKLELKDLEFIAKRKVEKAEEAKKAETDNKEEPATALETDDKVETKTTVEADNKVKTETTVETDDKVETETAVEIDDKVETADTDAKEETTEEEKKESNE